jgi:hypothetical protein
MARSNIFLLLLAVSVCSAFVPLLDGGKDMPKLYDGWFDDQIAKQASAAVSRAIGAGKVSKIRCKIEMQSICGPKLIKNGQTLEIE